MKTITPEIRKQIFAQYFGNIYYYKNEFGTYKEKVEFGYHTNKHIEYDKAFLHLTPLSKMTDNDAIEISNVIFHESPDALMFGRQLANNFTKKLETSVNYQAFEYLKIYHILISKGYALPYMDYSVEDLVQLGVYKLR